VYGGTAAPLNIELDHNEIYHALRKESFHASILTMEIAGGQNEQVLLRSVQWHPYKQQVLHVDFQRVDANQALHTKVPLHFVNGDISPAVKLSGALISHVMNEVEIICLPSNLPQFIEVNLGDMLVGGSVHTSDLKLPIGVTLNLHGNNPVVASAMIKAGAAAAEEETAAGGEQPAA
jgi:large subunit ribosomal protein L25